MYDFNIIEEKISDAYWQIQEIEEHLLRNINDELVGKYFLNDPDSLCAYGLDTGYEGKILKISNIISTRNDRNTGFGIVAILEEKETSVVFEILDFEHLEVYDSIEEAEAKLNV